MKFFSGFAVIIFGLIISAVAAYFSIVGLAALFAGAAIPVIVMGASLEAGKLVSAAWLHANWHNPGVTRQHRFVLTAMVAVLMVVTALGIYGFLARGHLEQQAPLAATELRIAQYEQQIDQLRTKRKGLADRSAQLDESSTKLLGVARNTKEAKAAAAFNAARAKDHAKIDAEVAKIDAEINHLSDEALPLKMQTADVAAKLGPVRYVAQLLGWKDPTSAVQAMILLIMTAFDPLAVMMVLSGSISLSQWADRRAKARAPAVKATVDAEKAPPPAQNIVVHKGGCAPAQDIVIHHGGIPVLMPEFASPTSSTSPIETAPVAAPDMPAQEPVQAAEAPEPAPTSAPVSDVPAAIPEAVPALVVPASEVVGSAAVNAAFASAPYTTITQGIRLGKLSLNGGTVTPVPYPDDIQGSNTAAGDRRTSIAADPNGPMPDPQDKGWLTATPKLLRRKK